MALQKDAIEGAGVLVPFDGLGTGEVTVGLLGAKVDPRRAEWGADARYYTEVPLIEIERRILAIESATVENVLRMGEQLRNERNHREARAAEQAPGDNS